MPNKINMEATLSRTAIKGGEFLVRNILAHEIFIPEEFTEEQQMMAQAARDFIDAEITPYIERIDKMEPGLMSSIMTKAGELGLLGVSVPEEYGGLGMSFNTSMLMADVLGPTGSFSTAYGAHTGIGTLPIMYYGSEEQKVKYLPKLASGQWKASYCLTEPDAGSDANSGKTKARLNEAGTHYLITGQKMWISNAGFADLFIVFAKIDNDKNLTAFIVEKDYPGITLGEEEKKLGIKGSSTRQVFFNDCPVPLNNMLSDRENGFKIAVNILNIGRIKLAVAVIGACKMVIDYAVNYAKERKQFGQPIAEFGAIKEKLAEMAIRTFAMESAVYRAGADMENKIADLAQTIAKEQAMLKGVEQFAIEAALLKVLGSEVLDYVVDEGVQIYGGMGFSADAPMERAYRDARITRIYEGTNEINRMLAVGMTFKRAMSGEINLLGPAMAVAKELTSIPSFDEPGDKLFDAEKEVLAKLKKAILMVAGQAAQTLGPKLNDEQELLLRLADMMIHVYNLESVLLRVEKLATLKGEAAVQPYISLVKAVAYTSVERVGEAGREAVMTFAENDELKVLLLGLKRFTKPYVANTAKIRREIADLMIAQGKYAL